MNGGVWCAKIEDGAQAREGIGKAKEMRGMSKPKKMKATDKLTETLSTLVRGITVRGTAKR